MTKNLDDNQAIIALDFVKILLIQENTILL